MAAVSLHLNVYSIRQFFIAMQLLIQLDVAIQEQERASANQLVREIVLCAFPPFLIHTLQANATNEDHQLLIMDDIRLRTADDSAGLTSDPTETLQVGQQSHVGRTLGRRCPPLNLKFSYMWSSCLQLFARILLYYPTTSHHPTQPTSPAPCNIWLPKMRHRSWPKSFNLCAPSPCVILRLSSFSTCLRRGPEASRYRPSTRPPNIDFYVG